jgi:hypothetical protein|nr:MAG TPA: hypothetical protein [Caudoviricetes sp.]
MIYVKTGTYSSSSLVCNSNDVNTLKTQVNDLNIFKNQYASYGRQDLDYQSCNILKYVLGCVVYVSVSKTLTSGNTGRVTLFSGNPIGVRDEFIIPCYLHVGGTKVGRGEITITSSKCVFDGDSYGNAVSYQATGIVFI